VHLLFELSRILTISKIAAKIKAKSLSVDEGEGCRGQSVYGAFSIGRSEKETDRLSAFQA
jgi:hypothetical protein